jgi:poly-gamma-glutamate capsule biosynthesis protein CapA/YwtB (metallophosphatase superfamily)
VAPTASRSRLPHTARDAFVLSPSEWLRFHGRIQLQRLTGRWRYPIPTSGDFETMTREDIVYWLYKAQYPVRRAVEGSGLEAFFATQGSFRWSPPEGFRPSGSLRLSAAGDLMDHAYLGRSRDTLYAEVADTIFGADVCTANLECVVHRGSREYVIRTTEAPPLVYGPGSFEAVRGHEDARYTFVSTACNHSLDCGEAGVVQTRRALAEEGIAHHGTNESEPEASCATVVERNGIRLGMIAHTFGLNAKKPPAGKPWMVNRTLLNAGVEGTDFSRIERQIRDCRERRVDAIVGHPHWGFEHEYYPRPEQREVAHHLAELGLDVIIGHHPHVLQPVEHHRTRRDPHRVVPIYYSLGNLVNPFSHEAFRLGGVARVQLSRGTMPDGTTRTYVTHADRAAVFQEIDERSERIRLVPHERSTASRLHAPPHLRCD